MASFIPGSIEELHAASRDYSRTYNISSRNKDEPDIPNPAIFAGLGTDASQMSMAHCAVHLELLEAFKFLRECVIKSNQLDVVFNTMPLKRYTTSLQYNKGRYLRRKKLLKPVKDHDSTFQERRKAKWLGFLDYAFLRFTSWATAMGHTRYNAITGNGNDLANSFIPPLGISSSSLASACTEFPVDVLTVWHAFLLKPGLCMDWCKSQKIEWILRLNFPWKHVVSLQILFLTSGYYLIHQHTMIDGPDRLFHLPALNARTFRKVTGLEPDLLVSLISDRKDALPMGRSTIGQQSADTASIQKSDFDFDQVWQSQDMWVDHMCHFLWIRSPALEFTLREAGNRYRQFCDLLASSRKANPSPPPDVELAWLTHQLSPSAYAKWSTAYGGRIAIENIALEGPDKGMVVFSRCLCWDCQNLQRLAEKNPDDRDPEKLVERSMQEIAYYRALEYARRKKIALHIEELVDKIKEQPGGNKTAMIGEFSI